ncbi:MarR family winged helix-turn-helix transcriptional regulator [Streptomyces sp. NPDC004111]|uniref:MarR family winged helix-turn-helix transcriptional regulator n=1 Tax=Streptomyces sp. NPDC004111 TaxID=3364690 RepID=UPI00368B7BC1
MRRTDPAAEHPSGGEAAEAARAVVEQLEMLWERGRDAVPTAPVSTSQLRVLYVLEQRGSLNLRELGDHLGAAPSSASRLCDRLQAIGYLDRSFSTADRREVRLCITSLGRSYLADLRAHRERALAATLGAMTPQERDALARGLTAFRRAHQAASMPSSQKGPVALRSEPDEGTGERPSGPHRGAAVRGVHEASSRTA